MRINLVKTLCDNIVFSYAVSALKLKIINYDRGMFSTTFYAADPRNFGQNFSHQFYRLNIVDRFFLIVMVIVWDAILKT